MQLYEKLLQFNLFYGMGHDDLEDIVTHTKFDFFKVLTDQWVAHEGNACDRLLLMTSGTVDAITEADDHGYRIHETLTAPLAIQPEHLYGLIQRYHTSFRALTDCNIIAIGKADFARMCEQFNVFRINYLNLLSTMTQRASARAFRKNAGSDSQRIVNFIASRCLYPAGQKTIEILMERLALELNCSRRDVSDALGQLRKTGTLQTRRGKIIVPSLEKLHV